MNLKNHSNPYQAALGRTFDLCPKAVIAAAFASLASSGGDRLSEAEPALKKEWWILYNQGIVPQRPPFPEQTDSVPLGTREEYEADIDEAVNTYKANPSGKNAIELRAALSAYERHFPGTIPRLINSTPPIT